MAEFWRIEVFRPSGITLKPVAANPEVRAPDTAVPS